MIQLASNDISQTTKDRLSALQNQIDREATFAEKAEKAKSLWSGKSGSNAGKAAFDDVKSVLESMCVSVEVCNYCEQNEANDIEHIAPKSFFPEWAFVWDNYLLACKQCNSGYKLDKCHVLDDSGILYTTERGNEPIHKTHCFINPRTENPNDFLILNMMTYTFQCVPGLTTKDKNKAEKTLEILQLNERDKLIEARRKAAIYYYDRLERLTNVLEATTLQEVTQILTPADNPVDLKMDLTANQEIIKQNIKNDILTHQHPSVWYAIKTVGRIVNVQWSNLFNQIPEAQNW
ncbi:MAG: hypothetical protein R3E32_25110 [Chitinophagales bacterium]